MPPVEDETVLVQEAAEHGRDEMIRRMEGTLLRPEAMLRLRDETFLPGYAPPHRADATFHKPDGVTPSLRSNVAYFYGVPPIVRKQRCLKIWGYPHRIDGTLLNFMGVPHRSEATLHPMEATMHPFYGTLLPRDGVTPYIYGVRSSFHGADASRGTRVECSAVADA